MGEQSGGTHNLGMVFEVIVTDKSTSVKLLYNLVAAN